MYEKSKFEGYVFLNALGLNGERFKSKLFILEEVEAKQKDCTAGKQSSLNHQFAVYYLNIAH